MQQSKTNTHIEQQKIMWKESLPLLAPQLLRHMAVSIIDRLKLICPMNLDTLLFCDSIFLSTQVSERAFPAGIYRSTSFFLMAAQYSMEQEDPIPHLPPLSQLMGFRCARVFLL